MKEHYERLLNSCKILRITPAYTADELCEITIRLLAMNGDHEDVYVRPVYYKSSHMIGVKLTPVDDDFLLFSVPMGPYLAIDKGLRVKVSSWRHISDNAIPMRAKVVGAYANAALGKNEALEDGYDEAVFLTSEGHVSEGSAENVFIVRDGTLITPPVTADILEGITRDTVIRMAEEQLGLQVVERHIGRTELYVADEAFFVGTGAQVSPICKIDRRPVGDGAIGPISKMIQQMYFDVVRGRVAMYRGWCQPVSAGGEERKTLELSAGCGT